MPRTRTYGGEVLVPVGQTIVVSAPLGGEMRAPEGGVPQPGRIVRKGQPIFQLFPLLNPTDRTNLATAYVDATGQVESAKTQVGNTKIALDRARRLLTSVGSQAQCR